MSRATLLAALGLVSLLILPACPQAQEPKGRPAAASKPDVRRLTREERLDRLFERLAKATSPEQAKPLAQAIDSIWMRSGSDTVDLLMSRAGQVLKEDDSASIVLLDQIVSLKPDFAEAWNKRATVYFVKKDYDRAMHDLREVLTREPRHYGAWVGLGRILEEFGSKKRALEAYRKAIAINPQIEGIDKTLRSLAIEVEGRDI